MWFVLLGAAAAAANVVISEQRNEIDDGFIFDDEYPAIFDE